MSRADAIRAIEANTAGFLLAMGRAGGGEERDERAAATARTGATGHIRWTIGGSPIAYHNAVVAADLTAEQADAAIDASIERFRALGVPGCWHVGPSMRPHDLRERLRARGFTGCEPGGEPGMVADLDRLRLDDVRPPVGLVIEPVRDLHVLDDYRSVLAAGFGEGPPEAAWVSETFGRIGLDAGDWLHLVGRVGGVPVATVTMFFATGVAGLYFVCTVPEHRRRGVGAATTLEAMRLARDRGFERAVLTSSPMGYGIYARLGFREVCHVGVPEYDPRSSGD